VNTLGVVRKNTYFDSVTLMGISKQLHDLPGVAAASVSMGTDMNKEVLESGGFDGAAVADAGPNDLMIACLYEDGYEPDDILARVEGALSAQNRSRGYVEEAPKTVVSAAALNDANLVVVSVPGAYAAAEACKALRAGLHVMMFSDNVSLEDEVALKQLAHEKNLLMMGPDCGTAIIQGVPLCFANKVRRGPVGIVGASGTGSQELSVLLDAAGIGVSQLIGTGGRDLSEAVGGIMFLDGIDALEDDPETTHLLLVSKPPHPAVLEKVCERIERSSKPVVACFLGAEDLEDAGNAIYVSDLESAVHAVMALLDPEAPIAVSEAVPVEVIPSGSYLRGLFCGGTLMEEAKQTFFAEMPETVLYSNSAKGGAAALIDVGVSQGHTVLDLGDDFFTQGRPHPMIDPTVRNERIVAEASDPETAVILLDFVLGLGAHDDPVGAALPAIRAAQDAAMADGRQVVFVAYVLGTDDDPQDKASQCRRLAEAGVTVCASNAQAAKTAVSLVKEVR